MDRLAERFWRRLVVLVRFILRSAKRVVVVVVGFALLVVGAIMMVTPGPGILFIVASLAVLATEFAWADHLLDKAKAQAAKAKDKMASSGAMSRATARVRRNGKAGGTVVRLSSVDAVDGTQNGRVAVAPPDTPPSRTSRSA